jgi:hypothetical protein
VLAVEAAEAPPPAVEEAEAVDIAVAGKPAVDTAVVDRPAAGKRAAVAVDRAVAAVADRRAAAAADKAAEDMEDIAGTADIAAATRKADKAAAAQAFLPVWVAPVRVVVDKRVAVAAAAVAALQRRRP